MKKLIAILLALALALSMAACARQAESQKEAESTTAAASENTSETDEKALISVGSAEAEDKGGAEIARGAQSGTEYENSSLGIKIAPPSSFESFADDDEGEGVPSTNNDYFVIELTENHDGIVYKTVTVSITEETSYSDSQAYISHVQSSEYVETRAIGEVAIGGRVYTCIKYDYPDTTEDYSVDYILVENGTLVVLGFDQFTDSEVAEFFANYISQY